MNPGLQSLKAYPFERLGALRRDCTSRTDASAINMSIGEPQHPTPAFILEAMARALGGIGKYPATRGSNELREAICAWLAVRFELAPDALDPNRHVLPVNGTREALFSIAQCLIDPQQADAAVLMPNPFYQIYEGAALLAGASPIYIACPEEEGFLPALHQVDAATWERCQLLYLCTPGNPSGRVMGARQLGEVLELADRHDFVIVSDECYSELYLDEQNPPLGLLQCAWALGRTKFERCLVMHSLSKRSNAPGLRSGFVAGDEKLIEAFLRYRTYHGSAMPLHVQAASIAAWQDEVHVRENRDFYREKFAAVMPILSPLLNLPTPEAGFYLWPKLEVDDIEFCRRLIEEQNVITLPGQFLAREIGTSNPGKNRLRIVLTDELEACVEGARRIAALLET